MSSMRGSSGLGLCVDSVNFCALILGPRKDGVNGGEGRPRRPDDHRGASRGVSLARGAPLGHDEKAMNTEPLLTRDQFRERALLRDGGRCALCGKPATEVHHIMERRLFTDPGEEGGYFLSNALSVDNDCHRLCEMTLVTPEQARAAAGITRVIIPASLYDDGIEGAYKLDKWGNSVLDDGHRSPGPLFWDESVQKILREGGSLPLFTTRIRYPRTYHVPFSPGVTKGDRIIDPVTFAAVFSGKRVISSLKLDGESASVYPDGFFHARSPEGAPHPSQSRIRAWAAAHAYEIPPGWRLSLENLQAVHSIAYNALPAHFVLLSVWDERNVCLPYDVTLEWAQLLGVPMPPVLYDGPFDEKTLRGLWRERDDQGDPMEGWVMRTADPFEYKDFKYHVNKWVRAGHVAAGSHHWRRGPLIENKIRE